MKTTLPTHWHSTARIGVACLVGLSLFCTSCTSTRFQSATQGADLAAGVRVGDRVDCKMQDGSSKGFTVTGVEVGTLIGESQRVPVAEIATIEITRFDGKKTIVEAGKVVGGLVLLSGLLALCLVTHGVPITAFR